MNPTIRFFLAIFIICISTSVSAQTKRDSLLKELHNANDRDTIRAKILIDLVSTSLFSESDTSLEKMAQEALQISTDRHWERGISLAYQRLGIIESYLRGDYAKAMRYYNLSLNNEMSIEQPDSVTLLYNYTNMASLYFDTRQFQKAFQIYQKAKSFMPKALKGTPKDFEFQTIYANALAETGNTDSALYLYETYAPKITSNQNYPIVLGSLGYLYYLKKEYAKSLSVLRPLIKDFMYQPASVKKSFILNNLATVEANVGNKSEALKLGQLAIKVADSVDNFYFKSKAYGALADAYRQNGEYKKAMDAYDKFFDLKDSASSEDRIQEMAFTEAEGEFERQAAVTEAEHKAELQNERRIRYTILGGAGLVLLAGGLLFISYKKRRETQQQLKTSQLNEKLASTELKALRSQMNPHFIFNSLNSIADYINKQDPKAATAYTTRFAKLMRLILENSEKKEICLADELKALELYMQLEAQRTNNKFTYQVSVDENLDPEETLIPPLLLQPFVENSIWHGIAKKEGTGHINIRIQKEGEMINCIVEDDGIGRQQKEATDPVQEKPSKQSLGMKITQSRIDILNKLKNSNAGLQLTDLAQGLRVELRLPLELSF